MRATPPETVPRTRPRALDTRAGPLLGDGLLGPPGFGTAAPSRTAPQIQLAPRPNREIEPPRTARGPEDATLAPTLINPRLPGRGMAADGVVSQQEHRLLDRPAAGARFSAPVTW